MQEDDALLADPCAGVHSEIFVSDRFDQLGKNPAKFLRRKWPPERLGPVDRLARRWDLADLSRDWACNDPRAFGWFLPAEVTDRTPAVQ